MNLYRRQSRKRIPVQFRLGEQQKVQPVDVPDRLLAFYSSLYTDASSNYNSPYVIDPDPDITRADMLQLARCVGKVKLKGMWTNFGTLEGFVSCMFSVKS